MKTGTTNRNRSNGRARMARVQEQAGGLPTESQSGGSEPPSIPRQVEPAKAANPPVKALFDDVPADEVPPPLGPLVVVASIRKTGNPPNRSGSSISWTERARQLGVGGHQTLQRYPG